MVNLCVYYEGMNAFGVRKREEIIMIKWTVLNIGQFSRNRYWGESDDQSYRGAICTSTVLSHDGKHIIVDPGFESDQMAELLDARTGLTPKDISAIYITHSHADHFMGLERFIGATFYTAPEDYEHVKKQFADKPELARKIYPAPENMLPGLKLLPLPGHTLGLCGLLFEAAEGRVAITGDAVMTRDFYRDARGYYNSADFEMSAKSIQKLYEVADIVIPGHDNYFIAKAYR